MNAAFVDIGLDKNAFLYAGDIQIGDALLAEQLRGARIERLVHSGQTVMVQVVKEPGGSKGPRLSCHITLAGRLAVLLPTVRYVGVSRRIHDEAERERLRAIAEGMAKDFGCGVIVRTAAEGAGADDLRADFEALSRLWENVERRGRHTAAPALLHRDASLVDCAVRDMLCEDVESARTDDEGLFHALQEAAQALTPALAGRVVFDRAQSPLFDRFCVWKQAESALRRHVWLKSGGYLVFDYTEALTVVDVNTGKYVGKRSLSETVFALNCEAAREIARQLRLRDVGGIIIVDFIDMDQHEQREALLDVLRECLRKDRTRTNLVGITGLGLVELTRKKVRQPLCKQKFHACAACQGSGLVPSHEFTARQGAFRSAPSAHAWRRNALSHCRRAARGGHTVKTGRAFGGWHGARVGGRTRRRSGIPHGALRGGNAAQRSEAIEGEHRGYAMNERLFVSESELHRQREFAARVRDLPDRPRTFHIVTMGCQMNERDSETIAGMLVEMGLRPENVREKADLILYNTCCVRENAENRALGNVIWLKELKKERPELLICVGGCMAQEEGMAERMKAMYPFIDLVFGTHNMHRLPEYLCRALESRRPVVEVLQSDGVIAEGLPQRRASAFFRLCEHHVRLQQLLFLLHRAVCARAGAFARARGRAGGV